MIFILFYLDLDLDFYFYSGYPGVEESIQIRTRKSDWEVNVRTPNVTKEKVKEEEETDKGK